MTAAHGGKANIRWSLAALAVAGVLAEVTYRTLLTAKFGSLELQTAPVLVRLLVSAVVVGYGMRTIEGTRARVVLIVLLLATSVVGLLGLLLPGSPFPFFGIVHQPWGSYVFTMLLVLLGTFVVRAVAAKQGGAMSYPRASAVAAGILALLLWCLAFGGFSYFYANK